MKKNKESSVGLTIFGFLLFFLTIGLASVFSILVFDAASKNSDGNLVVIGFSVLGIVFVSALVCVLCDLVRRKIMIERPSKMILDATQKIASGDFSVKLQPLHEYSKRNEYDLIFENINTMAAELSKNEMLKNDFISNVSHEIKTPLAVIQNYAKALQSNIDDKKKKEYLKGLEIQTKKLSDLISNILKLNKLENQKIVPEIEKIDLAELLRVLILQFESLIEKKELELVCDIEETSIASSASLLEIVFNNLISNAIKFTEKGGKIEISLKNTKTHAIVEVSDTGCGISSEVGEHIFDKFFQGDTSRASEGNGLGLALVKRVIDIVGGEILVDSKLRQGSTFVVKLKKEGNEIS